MQAYKSKHNELFPKRNEKEYTMCNTKFDNKEDLNNYIDEKHSPNSCYEKLLEDISCTCRVCQRSFSPSDIEAHIRSEHKVCREHVGQV